MKAFGTITWKSTGAKHPPRQQIAAKKKKAA